MAESLEVFGPRRFVSALAVRISARDGAIEFVNAGHPAAACVGHDGACRWLESTAPIVHPALHTTNWARGEAVLAPGERLVLYTDGLIEAHGTDGPFAIERLQAELTAATRDGREPVAAVLETLERFTGGRPLEDDVALVAVPATGSGAQAGPFARRTQVREGPAMRMRWFLLTGALLAAASCVPLSDEVPKKQLTLRERDSLIGESALPGAAVVKRSLSVSDESSRRSAAMDSLTQ